ncbi:hypothetical protein Tco_0447428, partial [Tanacetum coccineum]
HDKLVGSYDLDLAKIKTIPGGIAILTALPIMLDSYTSDMCMQSWGRSSYARVMIELRADGVER